MSKGCLLFFQIFKASKSSFSSFMTIQKDGVTDIVLFRELSKLAKLVGRTTIYNNNKKMFYPIFKTYLYLLNLKFNHSGLQIFLYVINDKK